VQKTVTLAPKSWKFEVQYQLSGSMNNQPLYVRHGLSPNLYDLLTSGQATLGNETHGSGVMTLVNTNYETTVIATIGYADAGHNSGFNTGAVDDDASKNVLFNTVNMRNQAQTHQVEMVGTNSFAFSLGFRAAPSDWNGDGMPNTWVDQTGLSTNVLNGATQDADGDTFVNKDEYTAGTHPQQGTNYLRLTTETQTSTGIVVRFLTELKREYFINYGSSLTNSSWTPANTNGLAGTGGIYSWTDDGALTEPDPANVTNRFYRIGVALPQ
jgi:hypothetical protein